MAILIFSAAVVGMQMKGHFAKVMRTKEVVEHADHTVRPFATVDSLVNKIV